MSRGQEWRCAVCGEPADENNSAVCTGCGRRFHLNPRSDRPGKDCGEVWLNEVYLALQFGCFNCLRQSAPAPSSQTERQPPPRAARARRRYRRRAP